MTEKEPNAFGLSLTNQFKDGRWKMEEEKLFILSSEFFLITDN
jgi:hypothetical protein